MAAFHLASFRSDVLNSACVSVEPYPADLAMDITLPWTEMGQQKYYLISESHMSCHILSLYILWDE